MTDWPLFGGLLVLWAAVTGWAAWLTRNDTTWNEETVSNPGTQEDEIGQDAIEVELPWTERWRAAVARAEDDPSEENFAGLDRLRREHILAESDASAARRMIRGFVQHRGEVTLQEIATAQEVGISLNAHHEAQLSDLDAQQILDGLRYENLARYRDTIGRWVLTGDGWRMVHPRGDLR
jgi:hypothetical protein